MKFNLKLNNNIICIILLLAILAGIVIIFLRQNNNCMMDDEEDVVEEFRWPNWRSWWFRPPRHRRPRHPRRQYPIFKEFTQYNNSNINYGDILETQSGNTIASLSNCIARDDCDAVVRFSNSNILWGSNLGMEGMRGATTYMKK
jgi:hypothetical protein